MTITIKDIAKKVGVSPSTVSRVINGNSAISEETKKKIFLAMEELDYHTNSLARNFANGSTNAIGLIIDAEDDNTFSNAFFNRSVYAIETVAQSQGYNLLITNNRDSMAEKLVFEKKVDGIILPTSSVTSRLVEILKKNNFPFIILGEPEKDKAETNWIDINNVLGSESAIEHFAEMGYKKIAFVIENQNTLFAKNRIQGYKSGIKNEGLEYDENFIVESGDDVMQAYEIAIKMLDSKKRPDAFLCSNNILAFQVLKALKQRKVAVPEEVGIITFDNYPIAEYMDPPLTVVDVDTYSLGEQAATSLIKKIHRIESGEQQTIISTKLIIRESSNRKKD